MQDNDLFGFTPAKSIRDGIANIDYGYTDGRLTTLDRKTFRDGAEQHQYYYFAYNAWGQPTTTKVGSRTLSTNTYYNYKGDNTGTGGNLKQTTYGNNQSVTYSYDELDRLIRKTYNDTNEYTEYSYNAEGMIGELRHCSIQNGQSTLTTYRFEYDSLGRLVRSSESVGDTVKLRTEHIYDGYNRLSKQKWSANGSVYTEYYTYNDGASGDGSLKQFRTTSGQKINLTYDKLKRLQKSSITSNGGVEYYTVGQSYYTSGNKTTPRVEYYNYRMTGGALIAGDRYVYDELGNITEIQESEPVSGSSVRRTKVRYTYDDQNQLKTETRYTYSSNADTTGSPVTTTYTYDTAGNLRSASDGTSTLSYEYNNNDWKDLLTKVGGTTISYDGSGNPANWYNGTTSYSGLTWKNGRQLAQITTGGKTSKYTYDADGIRSTKDVNGTKHEYRTLNGKVVWEKIGEGTSAKIMVFSYDTQGRPFGFKFSKNNGASYTNYFYALNQQGDVMKIFRPITVKDADGNVTGYTEKTYATYTYDAWGKLTGILDSGGNNLINKQTTSTALANLNPLRYCGYYYDNETGFYYLQSRYYDPTMRRFLNADAYASTGQGFVGVNMFAYCTNNPVTYADHTGTAANSIFNVSYLNDGGYSGNTSRYDRNAAINYAEKWYDSYNSEYYRYTTDCANFVSQCVFNGGIEQTESWHSYREEKTYWYNPIAWLFNNYRYSWDVGSAWRLADEQCAYFSSISGNKLTRINSASEIAGAISSNNIQAGDLMYFVNQSGNVHHATIITKVENDMIYYAGHTSSCFNRPLIKGIGDESVIIIMIS